MSIDRKKLKTEARTILREAKPSPVFVTLAFLGIIAVLQVLSMAMNGDFAAMEQTAANILAGDMTMAQSEGAMGFGRVLTVAIEIMAAVLGVGYTLYILRITRRIKASVGDIFDAFGLFLRALLASYIPMFLVTAWCMIYMFAMVILLSIVQSVWIPIVCIPLLIPAYKAAYAYRQTVYIMLDCPQLNVMQCVGLSKAVMEGHKWELFVLDLSFLGWDILCAIPLVGLWVRPYKEITYARYYAQVMTDFALRTGQVPNFREGQDPTGEDEPGTGEE